MKIGAAGFIVPFMLIYEPAILMIGTWPAIIQAFVTASFGILLFAGGLHGYFLTAANYWQRALLIAGGIAADRSGLRDRRHRRGSGLCRHRQPVA